MKEYADRTRGVQESTLKVGQTVLIKQGKRSKFSTRCDHRPFRVIDIKGTMLTAERAGVQRTNHVSHFKPYEGPLHDESHDLSALDEEEEDRGDPQPEQERRYPARE